MKHVLAIAILSALSLPAFSQAPPDPALQHDLSRLATGTEAQQIEAVRAIKSYAPTVNSAIPALRTAFRECSFAVQVEIAAALAAYGPSAKEAIPDLVAAISQQNWDNRLLREVARAVAALGEPGQRELVRACLGDEGGGRAKRVVGFPNHLLQYPAETAPVVAEFLSDPNRDIRARAANSLARLAHPGEGNKPSALSTAPPAVRSRAIAELRKSLEDLDGRVRAWSVAALIDADRTTLREVLPVFVTLIRKQENYRPGLEALVRTGSEGATRLIDYMDDPADAVRAALVEVLPWFRENGLPALASGLHHASPRVREGSIKAILQIRDGASLRTKVAARLGDVDESVRLAAAITLVGFDPKRAGMAIPVLTEISFSANASRRMLALYTLRDFGRDARPAVADMLRRSQFGNSATRLAAAEVLATADRSTWQTFVPMFIEALHADSGSNQHKAIELLRDVGPNAHAALSILRPLLKNETPETRVKAAEAVSRIDPDHSDDAIACLVGELNPELGLGRRKFRHWRQVTAALIKIGPAAKSAVPALLELMGDIENEDIAPQFALAAIRLDPENAQAAYDAFRAQLQPANPEPDDQWLARVVELGKAAKPLLPNLIAALTSKYDELRSAALETLTVLGPDAKDALPALREMAKSGKEKDRAREVIVAIEGKK